MKSDGERLILHNFTHMWNLKQTNNNKNKPKQKQTQTYKKGMGWGMSKKCAGVNFMVKTRTRFLW